MRSLKDKGMEELFAFRNRLARVFGKGDIGSQDYEYIRSRIDQIEARLASMRERGEDEF